MYIDQHIHNLGTRQRGRSTPLPSRFPSREWFDTPCTEGWVGLKTGLEVWGTCRLYRSSNTWTSSP